MFHTLYIHLKSIVLVVSVVMAGRYLPVRAGSIDAERGSFGGHHNGYYDVILWRVVSCLCCVCVLGMARFIIYFLKE